MTLHFLHVGKTGGTAIKEVLVQQLGMQETPYGRLQFSAADTVQLWNMPKGEKFFFCVRDPIARYASAFYSRLAKGRPRYFFDWSAEERLAFERWPTPQELADALGSPNVEEREAAEAAMRTIRHIHRMSNRFGNSGLLERRIDDIVYIGRQETLANDWQHLRRILGAPEDTQLPNDPVRAHRGDQRTNRTFSDSQLANLKSWFEEDFRIVEFAEQLRADRGWGVEIPGAVPGLAQPSQHVPLLPDGPLTNSSLESLRTKKVPPFAMWGELLNHAKARNIAEVGVFRGRFAQEILNVVPTLESYLMLGPDERPAGVKGRDDVKAAASDFAKAIERTNDPSYPRTIIEAPLIEGIERIPDDSLDAFILGHSADQSLRGATLIMQHAWPKVREGGLIGGFGFRSQIFGRGLDVEPGMLFPYVLYFAESVGTRLIRLPHNVVLIVKDTSKGFDYYDATDSPPVNTLFLSRLKWLAEQIRVEALEEYEIKAAAAEKERWRQSPRGRASTFVRRARRSVRRRVKKRNQQAARKAAGDAGPRTPGTTR